MGQANGFSEYRCRLACALVCSGPIERGRGARIAHCSICCGGWQAALQRINNYLTPAGHFHHDHKTTIRCFYAGTPHACAVLAGEIEFHYSFDRDTSSHLRYKGVPRTLDSGYQSNSANHEADLGDGTQPTGDSLTAECPPEGRALQEVTGAEYLRSHCPGCRRRLESSGAPAFQAPRTVSRWRRSSNSRIHRDQV